MANLQRILDLLDERTLAQEVWLANDMARERYRLERATVSDWDEFLEEITTYYEWHFRQTRGDANLVKYSLESSASKIVEQAYSSQGGMEAAVRNAKTGTGGGLSGVLTAIAQHLRQEHEEHYVGHILRKHINPMDWDEVVDLMRQYLRRFGGDLPRGSRVKKPEELAKNWRELITMHAKVMSAVRDRLGL
jgi:hypothetical protein